mgnify:CR=1 FL=1
MQLAHIEHSIISKFRLYERRDVFLHFYIVLKSLKYIDNTSFNEWELPPHQELFSDLINDKFNETMSNFESVGEVPLHQFRNALS